MPDNSGSIAAAHDACPAGNPGPGTLLRSARNARGLSRAEAAEALRLDESSIAALEEENFARIGAPVFVRGHLRRYAELLGLSAQALLDAYRTMAPCSEALPDLSRRREIHVPRRSGSWGWALAGGAVLLAALLAWTGSRSYLALSPAAAAGPAIHRPATTRQDAVPDPPPVASPALGAPVPAVAPAPELPPTLTPVVQPAAAVPVDATAAADSGTAADGG